MVVVRFSNYSNCLPSKIVALTGLPIGYSVIVALTGLPMLCNVFVDPKKKGLPTWLKQGLEQLEREKQRKAEQEASRKKRKSRWSDAVDEDDSSQVYIVLLYSRLCIRTEVGSCCLLFQ